MLFHALYWLFGKLNDFDPEAISQIPDDNTFKTLYFLGLFLVCLVLPSALGMFLAKRVRMKDYGWKLGLILVTLFFGVEVVGRIAVDDVGRAWNMKPWTAVSPQQYALNLGVDLKGGVILIYEVEEEAGIPDEAEDAEQAGGGQFSMSALVEALSRRINPSGTKEIVIRPYGERQVEIIIPEVDQREVDQIKKRISTAGVLQFRIVANSRDHSDIIELAEEMARDPVQRRSRVVRNAAGEPVGLWARVGRDQTATGPVKPFKVSVASGVIRDASTGEILEVPPQHQNDDAVEFAEYIASEGIEEIDVLMAIDDGYDVTGAHLASVRRGVDEYLNPSINFEMKGEGVGRFTGLTREYSPTGQFHRRLGIVLDNELLSAPNIQETIPGQGRITGRFTEEEVNFLVNILQAGSLPVVLNKTPISENMISPLLGQETIEQGRVAIAISLVVVLLFILLYYRFSGMVACLALIANLLFIVALMAMLQATFTLPGLAGLVLTVGMSVDANVLIFERIREELNRGSTLRMAIRNGFSRATTTIVDANLTTLITAIVLYAIGTDQIRGFAVILILGILMSMYTAIFCSRAIFDTAERTRRISRLTMTRMLGATQIDFLGKRRLGAAASVLLIGLGIAGMVARGADIFDIDFRGGTSVHVMFAQPVPTDEVREQLEETLGAPPHSTRFTLTAMRNTGTGAANTIFKVDSAFQEVEQLQSAIRDAFRDNDKLKLATYSLGFGNMHRVAAPERDAEQGEQEPETEPSGEAEQAAESEPAEEEDAADAEPPTPAEQESSDSASPAADTGGDEPADPTDDGAAVAPTPTFHLTSTRGVDGLVAQAETDEPAAQGEAEEPAARPQDEEESAEQEPSAEVPGADEQEAAEPPAAEQYEVDLEFVHDISAPTLRTEIEQASEELASEESDFPEPYIELMPNVELGATGWDPESNQAFTQWTLRASLPPAQLSQLLNHLEDKFSDTPVWQASNKIGSQVAGRMQNKAIAALLASLLGIVAYIWIRFQRVSFGLAAVVALVHDVLITLGAIAVSAWLAGIFGFLLIEEFKISLPIVAALLTIIGYSLNDTIVVFDRIREVRGKSPDLTGAMINTSINQTLSRTLLTSATSLIVVLILYAFGGEGIHGFAFALVVGVIVGTYSSIFVASPALLWMTGMRKARNGRSAAA